MGYRSDVYGKGEVSLAADFKEKFAKQIEDWDMEYAEDNEFFYIKFGEMKWYDGYAEVNAINDWFESQVVGTVGLIAVGEDNQTEEWGSPWEVGLEITVVLEGTIL